MPEATIELPDGSEVKFTAATEEELDELMEDYLNSEFPDPTEED